jgi:hypothetical protein
MISNFVSSGLKILLLFGITDALSIVLFLITLMKEDVMDGELHLQ